MTLFISGRPSSRAHFPYQAGLRGNKSPPDPPPPPPYSLCPRDVQAAQLRHIWGNVTDQAVASSSALTCASLASRNPPPPSFFSWARTSSAHPLLFFPPPKSLLRQPPSLLFSIASSTKSGRCCSTLPLPSTLPRRAAVPPADA
jgi:hypothetical protein